MKEKVSSKSKESRKSLRVDAKEKVKAQKRKYDATHGSLEEQFKTIVESARTNTVSKIIRKQIQCSQSSQDMRVKVELADCCTPLRPNFVVDGDPDVAPSPATPPLPKRMRFSKDMEDVPSPEGMGGSSPPPSPNEPLKTETLFLSDQVEEEEDDEVVEATFFDAQDTSVIESGNGLNLDGLIEEIFVNHPDFSDPEGKEEDPLTGTSPEKYSEANKADINEPDLLTNTSPTTETEGSNNADTAPSTLQDKATEVNSDIYRADTELQGSSQEESGRKDTNIEENQETVPCPAEISTVSVALSSTRFPQKDGNGVKEPVPPILNMSDEMSSHGSLIEGLLNEEGFREDFSLSDSQILAIDAKCNLVGATTLQPFTDPILNGPQSEGSHVNRSKSLLVESAPTENTSMALPKPALKLGFSVPSAPRLDWMQKAAESRQRLRTITQELSRLNAMVLRARRTIWSRPQQDVERQPTSTSATDSFRFQPATGQNHLQPPHVSDLCHDPEWNLS